MLDALELTAGRLKAVLMLEMTDDLSQDGVLQDCLELLNWEVALSDSLLVKAVSTALSALLARAAVPVKAAVPVEVVSVDLSDKSAVRKASRS